MKNIGHGLSRLLYLKNRRKTTPRSARLNSEGLKQRQKKKVHLFMIGSMQNIIYHPTYTTPKWIWVIRVHSTMWLNVN